MSGHDLRPYWHLCQSCSCGVYAGHQPTKAYADRVARMLFGTGAQESRYRHSRQIGYNIGTQGGAFSYWQVELGSVCDSLNLIGRNQSVSDSVEAWLPLTLWRFLQTIPKNDHSELLRALVFSPELGVLMCRLHYLRVPTAIPATLEDQAVYWKRHYNTALGAGTPARYLHNWVALCAEVAK